MKTTTKTILIFLYIFSNVFLYSQDYKPEMVLVDGGTFLMGVSEGRFKEEIPSHNVKISSFEISKYEISNKYYTLFCEATSRKLPPGKPDYPASFVSWFDAIMFCNWLSDINLLERYYIINIGKKDTKVKFNKSASGYRLPTEAEWEFAARGGNLSEGTRFSGGSETLDVAWCNSLASVLHPVGEKQPNELGIYDMSGGVSEWCNDYYEAAYYSKSPKENPLGPDFGLYKVVRGGHFLSKEEDVRITRRVSMPPESKERTQGFRIVLKE